MAHVIELHSPDQRSDIPPRCEVDLEGVPVGWGGFGTVYPVINEPRFVAKRVAMATPEPIGNIGSYTVHVTETRARFEEILRRGAGSFPRQMFREILGSLALAWGVDRAPGGRMTALWFLQRKAPGRPLKEYLNDPGFPPPPIAVREQIANAIVARMRALRRADLVHLDCVDDNIFLDIRPSGVHVTLIDLDGCGIVKRSSGYGGSGTDFWLHKPFTFGHLQSTWIPAWYPQPNVDAGPRSGNYLYAERWVVVDTIIRVLTWNRRDSLSWAGDSVPLDVTAGYETVASQIAQNGSTTVGVATWRRAWSGVVRESAARMKGARVSIHAAEAPSLWNFERLAQRAYFDPDELSSKRLAGTNQESPYVTFDEWLR